MQGEIVIEESSESSVLAKGLSDICESLLKLSINIITAHWNLQGMEYGILHPKLGSDYQSVIESMDKVAERAVILGGGPLMGTQVNNVNPNTMLIRDVISSYEQVQKLINYFINNEGSKDEVSKNMLTDIQEQLQKLLGFLNQTYKCCEQEMEEPEMMEN
jgi:DNA-binding ferritin-like protein